MSHVYERSKESIIKWQHNNRDKYREINNKASRAYKARKKAWLEISADFRRILLDELPAALPIC